MSIDEAPVRRFRGRPPKLSATQIIEAARDVLTELPAEAFALGRVAERLGAPVTSLYNYFPNRFTLLAAVAETLFTCFDFQEPPPEMAWPDAVLAWLRALDAFFLDHPVAIKAIGVDDQTSPAWGSVRAPLLRQLRRAGFKGRDLAIAAMATHTQVVGLLFTAQYVLRPQPADGVFPGADASPIERDEAELCSYRATIRRDDIVGLGLAAIVASLQQMADRAGLSVDNANHF